MRALILGSIGLLMLAAPAAAQGHADTPAAASAAAAKPAAAPAAKPATPPTTSASKPETPAPAPAAKIKEESVAKAPLATVGSATQKDLKTMLERINKEVEAVRKGGRGEAVHPTPGKAARPRVTLDWRVPLVWPDELIADLRQF